MDATPAVGVADVLTMVAATLGMAAIGAAALGLLVHFDPLGFRGPGYRERTPMPTEPRKHVERWWFGGPDAVRTMNDELHRLRHRRFRILNIETVVSASETSHALVAWVEVDE